MTDHYITVTIPNCDFVRIGELLTWLKEQNIDFGHRISAGSTAMGTDPLCMTVTIAEQDAVAFKLKFGL